MYRIVVCCLFLFSWGCTRPDARLDAEQGTVIYQVSYPDSARYGMKAAFFPRQIHLFFSGSKATFVATGGMGLVQMVNLMDGSNRQAVSLLIDQLRVNYGCRLTADEIKANEQGSSGTFEYTGDTLTIAGRPAKGICVRDRAGRRLFTGYCDAHIPFLYWNAPFKGIDHLLLEYDHTVNGLTMHLSALSVDTVTPVDTGMFQIKGAYTWISQQELFSRISGL